MSKEKNYKRVINVFGLYSRELAKFGGCSPLLKTTTYVKDW